MLVLKLDAVMTNYFNLKLELNFVLLMLSVLIKVSVSIGGGFVQGVYICACDGVGSSD